DILGSKLSEYIVNSKSYDLIAKADLPSIVLNEEKLYPAKDKSIPTISNHKNKLAVINLYNGVTLEEGIKSNSSINEFAQNLVKGSSTDKEKAKKIYIWIGENIKYDDEKAKLIEKENKNLKSGAITAFENKEGVCFDYSCLYVAMCRAVGLKVKLVTGTAFNGKQWGPHAWNEVYLSEKNEWINVDTTFYNEKNSFGGKNFNETHKAENIIGEWK
ncbi:transglutaminase-like domain-containing protein, partial [Clostridium tarantellae]